jgi:plastocyanin
MKNLFLLLILTLVSGTGEAFGQQTFTLVSSEKKTVSEADLSALEKTQTAGKTEGSNLSFNENEIRLVATTGPEDDMLSYRIQGLRNPNLVVPSGATLRILFVNTDHDMRHDIRFGRVEGAFALAPPVDETAGSERLTPRSVDNVFQAEEIVVKASGDGAYKYFCSVRGHARSGMWGNIFVGVGPDEKAKMPEKQKHAHAERDEHDEKNVAEKPSEMKDKTADETKKQPMKTMPGMEHEHDSMRMSSSVDINTPMTQEGSGTSWIPASSPTYAYMKMFDDGAMLMLHGTLFARYTSVGSTRDLSVAGKGSKNRFDAPSMFMAMYSRPLTERSQLGLRAMVSLDPLIERGYGYPLLYQSGELYRGDPIHDRQHPHDFFSELAVTYSYKFNAKNSFFVYAGLPGEPALGPPAFMHRLSGMDNPDAPISHHWQDATHITWGVVTAGFNFGKFKIEGSAFKGEEPDENRWNFDAPRLDSFSARLSFNPNENWAFQISHGYLKNPEPSEPELKILRRTTASAIYNKKFAGDRNWASSFVWGQNYGNGDRTNSFLFETNYQFFKNSIYGRIESVQKSGHELVLGHDDDHDLGHGIFRVGLYSLGYVRDIVKDKGIDVGIGAQATLYTNPSSLTPVYGGTTHGGWQIFLRFRPSRLK